MAIQTLNTIKNWFKTSLKPSQQQFWDTWDSFRHKFDKVPVKDVDGIDELLNTKADKIDLNDHIADVNAHAPQVNTDWNSESGFSQLLNKPDFKTINGESVLGDGNITIEEGGLQNLDQTLANGNQTHRTALFSRGEDEDIYENTINAKQIEIKHSNAYASDKNKTVTLKSNLIDIANLNTGETTALFAEGLGFGNSNLNYYSILGMNPNTTANYSNVLMPSITEEGKTKTLATTDDFKTINGKSIIGSGDIIVETEENQDLNTTLLNGNESSTSIKIKDKAYLGQLSPGSLKLADVDSEIRISGHSLSFTNDAGNNTFTLAPKNTITTNSTFYLPTDKTSGNYTLATLEDQISASATDSGIINNTALQELGGVDKLINGVRIGKGGNNVINNTALGFLSLNSNTTGIYNVGVGYYTGSAITTGSLNVGIGGVSLGTLTTGSNNIAIGDSTLYNIKTGINNTAVGSGSQAGVIGSTNGANSRNTTIGAFSGNALISGNDNTIIGGDNFLNSGQSLYNGSNNTIIGKVANSLKTGNNNTFLGKVTSPNSTLNDNIILADGNGIVGIRKMDNHQLLAPSLTNSLIESGGAKSIITKEYFEEKSQIKNKQIFVNEDILVEENWNGHTIIFENSCIVNIPMLAIENFSFTGITLEGVNLTWKWANQVQWAFGIPEITPEKKHFSLTKIENTNQLILNL